MATAGHKKKLQSFLAQTTLAFDFNKLSDKPNSLKVFEQELLNAVVDKAKIAEILRFTCSTVVFREAFFIFCRSLAKLMNTTHQRMGILAMFWVSEVFPLYNTMQAIESISNIVPSLLISYSRIGNDEAVTCKGFLLNKAFGYGLREVVSTALIKKIQYLKKTQLSRFSLQ